MKKSKIDTDNDNWFGLLIGVLAIFAIKSIFENDSSKIISKKGRTLLSDEDKMNYINDKLQKLEEVNSHNEIIL